MKHQVASHRLVLKVLQTHTTTVNKTPGMMILFRVLLLDCEAGLWANVFRNIRSSTSVRCKLSLLEKVKSHMVPNLADKAGGSTLAEQHRVILPTHQPFDLLRFLGL